MKWSYEEPESDSELPPLPSRVDEEGLEGEGFFNAHKNKTLPNEELSDKDFLFSQLSALNSGFSRLEDLVLKIDGKLEDNRGTRKSHNKHQNDTSKKDIDPKLIDLLKEKDKKIDELNKKLEFADSDNKLLKHLLTRLFEMNQKNRNLVQDELKNLLK